MARHRTGVAVESSQRPDADSDHLGIGAISNHARIIFGAVIEIASVVFHDEDKALRVEAPSVNVHRVTVATIVQGVKRGYWPRKPGKWTGAEDRRSAKEEPGLDN
jgi:hypothetical protein